MGPKKIGSIDSSKKMAIDAVESMRKLNSISDDDFCRIMVEMAFNAIRNGDTESCAVAISKCPVEYFRGKQKEHMEEDSVFRDSVIYLAYKLIQLGLVDVGLDITTTQKRGLA